MKATSLLPRPPSNAQRWVATRKGRRGREIAPRGSFPRVFNAGLHGLCGAGHHFSRVSLSLSLFFYFSRTRRGLVQWKSRKERERGRRTPSKRERPPREEMRFSSFPRAFQSALSCPRCANVSIHPPLADFPLTPRRKPQSGSTARRVHTKRVDFLSLPPLKKLEARKEKKNTRTKGRLEGQRRQERERERRFLRSEMSRFSKIDKGVVRSVEGSRGTGHNRKRSLHFASHLSRRAAFNPPPSSH